MEFKINQLRDLLATSNDLHIFNPRTNGTEKFPWTVVMSKSIYGDRVYTGNSLEEVLNSAHEDTQKLIEATWAEKEYR